MTTSKNRDDSLHLQDRDFIILRGLFESRIMTSAHVAVLYFGGRKEAAKKRLQKLKTAGLIGERGRRVYEPSVLYLTQKAFAFLRAQGVLSEYRAKNQRCRQQGAGGGQHPPSLQSLPTGP